MCKGKVHQGKGGPTCPVLTVLTITNSESDSPHRIPNTCAQTNRVR